MRGKGRGRKESDVGIGLGSVDKVLHEVDGLDNAVNSPMSMDGDPNGSLSMDGVLGGLEMFPLKPGTIDVFSDSAVKIEEGGLDQIFASDEEDEGQEVCVCVCLGEWEDACGGEGVYFMEGKEKIMKIVEAEACVMFSMLQY